MTIAVGAVLFAAPAAAHGTTATDAGIGFASLVVGVIGTSLIGGASFAVVGVRYGRHAHRIAPVLALVLGVASVAFAIGRSPAAAGVGAAVGVVVVVLRRGVGSRDCGRTADVATTAVATHRALEGGLLGAMYATDEAIALVGAAVFAVHAAVETGTVAVLYATTLSHRRSLAAVIAIQAGFVAGAVVGVDAVGHVSALARTGLFGAVGGTFLAIGAREVLSWLDVSGTFARWT